MENWEIGNLGFDKFNLTSFRTINKPYLQNHLYKKPL